MILRVERGWSIVQQSRLHKGLVSRSQLPPAPPEQVVPLCSGLVPKSQRDCAAHPVPWVCSGYFLVSVEEGLHFPEF